MNFSKYLVLFSLLLLTSIACENSADNENETAIFDRTEYLTYTADAFIIPGYEALLQHTSMLKQSVQSFSANEPNITNLRVHWQFVAEMWQRVHVYDFGPADGSMGTLGQNIAIFPISEEKLQAYINQDDTSFQNFDRDTRGIYAIEYLIFTKESYSDFSESELNYLVALVNHLNSEVEKVYNAWNTDYRASFIEQNGTDAGSSISALVNAYALSFENIKNFKLGIPLGLRPGQIASEPQRVEAYYSGLGLILLNTHFQALKNLWLGDSELTQRSSLGLQEYLLSVSGGPELVELSMNAFQEIDDQLDSVVQNGGNLKTLVESSDNSVIELHNLFQRHTRFFKSDLASLLGIYITYNSGDGD